MKNVSDVLSNNKAHNDQMFGRRSEAKNGSTGHRIAGQEATLETFVNCVCSAKFNFSLKIATNE